MRMTMVYLMLLIFLYSCASTEQDRDLESSYENLVSLEQPAANQQQEESILYLDSAQKIRSQGQLAVLIRGSFPDGCSRLGSATHVVENDTLKITLGAWRDPDMMCSQALTSFSFIYPAISEDLLKQHDQLRINNKTYKLQ